MADLVAFNHLGQCVADLERSRRFYEELLGFKFWYQVEPLDESSAPLLRVEHPALTACYLVRDGLVLELLHFGGGTERWTERVMNEPGLTHVSVSVDDINATCAKVPDYGGEVLADTNIGAAVFIRDPDGQLIELLPMAYRETLPDRPD
jgi:catechol 2,3-dioxygenase-like lactoylglutathione lyase family enzyme